MTHQVDIYMEARDSKNGIKGRKGIFRERSEESTTHRWRAGLSMRAALSVGLLGSLSTA